MILLTKDRKIFKDNDYETQNESYERREVDSVIPFLSERIEIEKGFTLEDFFYLVERDKELMQIVFDSHLGHFPLQPFFEEVKKDLENYVEDSEIDHLELFWYSDVFEFEGETDFDVSPGFHGWGKYDVNPVKEEDFVYGGYAIEFTPINNLKHLEIKLNKKVKIYKNCEDIILEGKSEFTVYDLFGGILSELSFCGTPEMRDNRWEQATQDIEEMLEEHFSVEDKESNNE